MPKRKLKRNRASLQSTEPQAHKVLAEMGRRSRSVIQNQKDTGGKTTATSPPGVQKTKAKGEEELRKLREKRRKG